MTRKKKPAILVTLNITVLITIITCAYVYILFSCILNHIIYTRVAMFITFTAICVRVCVRVGVWVCVGVFELIPFNANTTLWSVNNYPHCKKLKKE